MTTTTSVGYRLDPLDRGVLGRLTRRQLAVVGSAAVIWLLLSVSGQGMLRPALLFAASFVVAVVPIGGQPIVDWMPLWAGWALRGRWSRHWLRPLHLTSATSPATHPVLPPWLGGLRIVAHPTDGWAAVHDTQAKTLTAHLQIAGNGFTTLSPDQMELLLSGWGAVFSTVPPSDGLVRITWSDLARRMPLVGHQAWIDEQRDRAGGGLDDYAAFIAEQAPMRHDLVITVTMRSGPLRGGAAQGEAMGRLLSAARIVRDALEDARLAPSGPLAAGEIAYLLRAGLDPTSVEPAGGVRAGSLVQRLGLVPVDAAGPMRAAVGTQHVEVDDVVHRSFWVESWPETPQAADWFDPLVGAKDLDAVTQRIFTLIIEPVDDDKALAELRSAAARHGGEQEAAREGRTRWDPFKQRKAKAVSEREEEVARGASAVAFSGLVVVTVDDPAELDRAAGALQRRYRRGRVLLRPLWGRMELGLAAALPLGLGLAREPF